MELIIMFLTMIWKRQDIMSRVIAAKFCSMSPAPVELASSLKAPTLVGHGQLCWRSVNVRRQQDRLVFVAIFCEGALCQTGSYSQFHIC